MKLIELINDFKCPIFDGMFFPDGKIFPLNLTYQKFDSGHIIHASIKVGPILNFSEKLNDDNLASFDWVGQTDYEPYQMRYGEGSYGSEGMAGLFMEDDLIWFLYLEESNPFCNARIKNNTVELESTNKMILSTPINTPELIKVIRNPDF